MYFWDSDRNWFHDDLSTLEFLRETSNNVLLDFKSSYFRVKEKLCTYYKRDKENGHCGPCC